MWRNKLHQLKDRLAIVDGILRASRRYHNAQCHSRNVLCPISVDDILPLVNAYEYRTPCPSNASPRGFDG
eukprot:2721553-Pyramimonas_sp.AAC.2